MPRRVLVTGGSGFIGRHVVTSLGAAGHEVRVVDLRPYPDPAVDIVVGDLARPDVVDASLDGGVDAVVHLAAVTSVLRSVEEPEAAYRTNVAATALLLERSRQAGVGVLVFASTNAVIGPMTALAIVETAPLRPLTPYGATKAAAEMLMSAYSAALGLRCAALRFTNVYGLGMAEKDSIVARLMRAALSGATFEIYGDGSQVRDYVNVTDVVAAIGLALSDARWSGPTVIGSGRSVSVVDIVGSVRRITGTLLPTRNVAGQPGEMPAVVVDNACARSRGWAPVVDLEAGIEAVWAEWSAAATVGAGPP